MTDVTASTRTRKSMWMRSSLHREARVVAVYLGITLGDLVDHAVTAEIDRLVKSGEVPADVVKLRK